MAIAFSDTIANLTMQAGAEVSLLLPEATGETGDIAYTLAPALPDGLLFNQTTRRITGAAEAPSAEANYTYTATDTLGSASLTFSITITADLESRGDGFLDDDREAYRNINDVLRGVATKAQLSYSIASRELQYRSISELKELEQYFAWQIRFAKSGSVVRAVED